MRARQTGPVSGPAGTVVMVAGMTPNDALHAQQETARCLLDECAADYLITAVKDNQPTMHDDLAGNRLVHRAPL